MGEKRGGGGKMVGRTCWSMMMCFSRCFDPSARGKSAPTKFSPTAPQPDSVEKKDSPTEREEKPFLSCSDWAEENLATSKTLSCEKLE